MVYTKDQRVELIFIYGSQNECARRTAAIFNERHPDMHVSHKYVIELVRKFRETGSVANKKVETKRVLTEANQIAITGHVVLDPTLSTRKLETVSGFSRSSIIRTLKLQNFHPYKIKLHQELNEDDFDRRVEFCETMINKISENADLVKHICFSDESTFFLNGLVNRHNCRYWSDENPHLMEETHTQTPQKINVWAGILGNKIIGPIFFENYLNGESYLEMLQREVDNLILEATENRDEINLNLNRNQIVFQQDGAPAHYAVAVREYLNNRFPGRWIGRRGAMLEWPARSPDLTSLDFFLWGHLKNVAYKTPPGNLNILKERIVAECRAIERADVCLLNVRKEFENRLYHCLAVNGAHFEHLLKK